MTHRVMSRNSASSRAVPVKKLIQDVLDDPYVPLFWGKNRRGMQADEEHSAAVRDVWDLVGTVDRETAWTAALQDAVSHARAFDEAGYHKQVVNRLLEPFSHVTVVATATEWSNFFALRRHHDAEPHIHLLADRTWEAMEASVPKLLKPGEWHIPFVDEADVMRSRDWAQTNRPPRDGFFGKLAGIEHHDAGVPWHRESKKRLIKLSVARCASTSYKTVDGFDMTIERAIELHDKLVSSVPMHASPCEHQAYADETVEDEYCDWYWKKSHLHGNLKGFVQYRKTLASESQ